MRVVWRLEWPWTVPIGRRAAHSGLRSGHDRIPQPPHDSWRCALDKRAGRVPRRPPLFGWLGGVALLFLARIGRVGPMYVAVAPPSVPLAADLAGPQQPVADAVGDQVPGTHIVDLGAAES
jgi:hypothetical protein